MHDQGKRRKVWYRRWPPYLIGGISVTALLLVVVLLLRLVARKPTYSVLDW